MQFENMDFLQEPTSDEIFNAENSIDNNFNQPLDQQQVNVNQNSGHNFLSEQDSIPEFIDSSDNQQKSSDTQFQVQGVTKRIKKNSNNLYLQDDFKHVKSDCPECIQNQYKYAKECSVYKNWQNTQKVKTSKKHRDDQKQLIYDLRNYIKDIQSICQGQQDLLGAQNQQLLQLLQIRQQSNIQDEISQNIEDLLQRYQQIIIFQEKKMRYIRENAVKSGSPVVRQCFTLFAIVMVAVCCMAFGGFARQSPVTYSGSNTGASGTGQRSKSAKGAGGGSQIMAGQELDEIFDASTMGTYEYEGDGSGYHDDGGQYPEGGYENDQQFQDENVKGQQIKQDEEDISGSIDEEPGSYKIQSQEINSTLLNFGFIGMMLILSFLLLV